MLRHIYLVVNLDCDLIQTIFYRGPEATILLMFDLEGIKNFQKNKTDFKADIALVGNKHYGSSNESCECCTEGKVLEKFLLRRT